MLKSKLWGVTLATAAMLMGVCALAASPAQPPGYHGMASAGGAEMAPAPSPFQVAPAVAHPDLGAGVPVAMYWDMKSGAIYVLEVRRTKMPAAAGQRSTVSAVIATRGAVPPLI